MTVPPTQTGAVIQSTATATTHEQSRAVCQPSFPSPNTDVPQSNAVSSVGCDRAPDLCPVPITPPVVTMTVAKDKEPLSQHRCVPEGPFLINRPMANLQPPSIPGVPPASTADPMSANLPETTPPIEGTTSEASQWLPAFLVNGHETPSQTSPASDFPRVTRCPSPLGTGVGGDAGQENRPSGSFHPPPLQGTQTIAKHSKRFEEMMTCGLQGVQEPKNCDPDKMKRAIDSVVESINDMVDVTVACISILPDIDRGYVRSLAMSFKRRLRERLRPSFVQQEQYLYLDPRKMAAAIASLVESTELTDGQRGIAYIQLFLELKKVSTTWRFNLSSVRPENVPEDISRSLWTVVDEPVQAHRLDSGGGDSRRIDVGFQNLTGGAQPQSLPHLSERSRPAVMMRDPENKTSQEMVEQAVQVLVRDPSQLQQFLRQCLEFCGRDGFLKMLAGTDNLTLGAAGMAQTSTDQTADSGQDFSFPPVSNTRDSPSLEPLTFQILSSTQASASG